MNTNWNIIMSTSRPAQFNRVFSHQFHVLSQKTINQFSARLFVVVLRRRKKFHPKIFFNDFSEMITRKWVDAGISEQRLVFVVQRLNL